MSLILRLDIDKPYGRSHLGEKLLSKFSEDVVEFKSEALGYLNHLEGFFDLLDSKEIKAFVYFRNCSSPTLKLKRRLIENGHRIGFHAEATQTESSFLEELWEFSSIVGIDVRDFSKHGSGSYKLGKRHYPAYEEEKYRSWSEKNELKFYFGNGMWKNESASDLRSFYPDMFWVEPHYREKEVFDISWLEKNVKQSIIPLITHPENIYADQGTSDFFEMIINKFSEDFISPEEFEGLLNDR